jgi:hypothetical protein
MYTRDCKRLLRGTYSEPCTNNVFVLEQNFRISEHFGFQNFGYGIPNCSTLSQSNKYLAFYEIRRFITVFKRVRHQSQFRARLTQSTSTHTLFIPVIYISTLSSHLRLYFPSGPFHSKYCNHFLSLPYKLHAQTRSSSWFHHSNNTLWRVQVMDLIMKFSPASCHFTPLRSKYSVQHSEHPQSLFVP